MAVEKLTWRLSDPSGAPILNAAPTVLIRNMADNQIYDWFDSTFRGSNWAIKQKTMTEVDQVNFPGVYETTLNIVPFIDGTYHAYTNYSGMYSQSSDTEMMVRSGRFIAEAEYSNVTQLITNVANVHAQIRANLTTELNHIMVLQNGLGLDSTQAQMLLEIYRIYGLDPSIPLIVSDTNRTAGAINQNIVSTANTTTVQRV